jgi:hypothetical protein
MQLSRILLLNLMAEFHFFTGKKELYYLARVTSLNV